MSRGNPNPNKENRFSSTNQPKKKGRIPSKLKKYFVDNSISAADISMLIKNVVFVSDEKKLQKMITDPEQPMLVRLFVRAFMQDFKNKRLDNIDKLLDRAVGKPKEFVETTFNDITEMSWEEREADYQRLMEAEKEKEIEKKDS